mmetsp:Transcript_46099/g.107818  ORF Transcript_46099/g.107818 Transcript_46099/m.107818 type:complete len:280 (-) Transcript_46099:2698-3537(-)
MGLVVQRRSVKMASGVTGEVGQSVQRPAAAASVSLKGGWPKKQTSAARQRRARRRRSRVAMMASSAAVRWTARSQRGASGPNVMPRAPACANVSGESRHTPKTVVLLAHQMERPRAFLRWSIVLRMKVRHVMSQSHRDVQSARGPTGANALRPVTVVRHPEAARPVQGPMGHSIPARRNSCRQPRAEHNPVGKRQIASMATGLSGATAPSVVVKHTVREKSFLILRMVDWNARLHRPCKQRGVRGSVGHTCTGVCGATGQPGRAAQRTAGRAFTSGNAS